MQKPFTLIIVFIHAIAWSFAVPNDPNESRTDPSSEYLARFRLYMNELQSAQKLNNDTALMSCYSNLSSFYSLSGIHEKAKYYKRKQIELIRTEIPTDSVMFFSALNDYQGILFSNSEEVDRKEVYRILNYALRNNDEKIEEEVLALYRSFLIQHNYFGMRQKIHCAFYEKTMHNSAVELFTASQSRWSLQRAQWNLGL